MSLNNRQFPVANPQFIISMLQSPNENPHLNYFNKYSNFNNKIASKKLIEGGINGTSTKYFL